MTKQIGPILRALVHSRGRFWLVALEIAFSVAVIANCIHLTAPVVDRMSRPSGLAEERLITIRADPFEARFEQSAHLVQVRDDDLRRLRRVPGVRGVCAIDNFPLSGEGSFTFRRAAGASVDPVGTAYFRMSEGALDALGVRVSAGRSFEASDFVDQAEVETAERIPNVIVTRALADLIFPDADAVGKLIESEDGKRERIVGIVGTMHNAWPESEFADYSLLYPVRPASPRRMRYLVRLADGTPFDRELSAALEEALLSADSGRLVSVRPLTELKTAVYGESRTLVQLFVLAIVLVLVVTSLGVVGLTSYNVTRRFREIGTRRALGARKHQILLQLLLESSIVCAIGFVAGVVLAYGVNWYLIRSAEGGVVLGPGPVVLSILALWSAALLATVLPGLRGARVPPVVATRTI